MSFVDLSPTNLVTMIFREFIPDGHAFDLAVFQEASILHITYGRRGEDSYHYDLDLNDPDGIERLRLEILLNDR